MLHIIWNMILGVTCGINMKHLQSKGLTEGRKTTY